VQNTKNQEGVSSQNLEKISRPRINSASSIEYCQELYSKGLIAMKEREERISQQRKEKECQQMENCTFKPGLSKKALQGSNENLIKAPMNPSSFLHLRNMN